MVLKVLGASGSGSNSAIIEAIDYARVKEQARARLVRPAGGAFSYIRVVERLQYDGDRERLLQRLAMVGDQVMVRIKAGIEPEEVIRGLSARGAHVRNHLALSYIYVIGFDPEGADGVPTVIRELQASGKIEATEPDYLSFIQ